MSKARRSKRSPAIDTVPVPETRKGRVTRARGKYYLTIGRRKLEIPVGKTLSAEDVRPMVGKDVYAAVSGSDIVALSPIPKWVLCYMIGEPFIRKVRPDVQKTVIEKMAGEKIITPRLKAELMRGL